MKPNKAHILIEAILQQYLLFPSGIPELTHDRKKLPAPVRVAYGSLFRIVRALRARMPLSTYNAIEAAVAERLIVEYRWKRVDGSLFPPEKVAKAVIAYRARAISPQLRERLSNFRSMSEQYRRTIMRGKFTKLMSLPA